MKLRNAAYGSSVLIVVAAMGMWAMTGREGYTRWPNSKLESTYAPLIEGENDLLADIGFDTEGDAQQTPDIESRFALGLVPGGTDPKHLISVASLTVIAVGISVLALFLNRKKTKLNT